jgi:ferredoxin
MAEGEPLLALDIDHELCAGHGRCYGLAPDLFGYDDRGYGVALPETRGAGMRGELERIVATCPEQAISIRTVSDQGARR